MFMHNWEENLPSHTHTQAPTLETQQDAAHCELTKKFQRFMQISCRQQTDSFRKQKHDCFLLQFNDFKLNQTLKSDRDEKQTSLRKSAALSCANIPATREYSGSLTLTGH